MRSEPSPIPLAEVSLDAEDTRVLGYFARDLQELTDSAFRRGGNAATLEMGGREPDRPRVITSASDAEIRSFVTVFRRLYMEKEPANFQRAVDVYTKALGDHPYGKIVQGIMDEHSQRLTEVPDSFYREDSIGFTCKRLMDVFLYTQYTHQPDDKRQRQYNECLAEVGGKREVLTWLFLTEMWLLSLEIENGGKIVVQWFKRYCQYRGISPDILASLRDDHEGLGAGETVEGRRRRVFEGKVHQLADELWSEAGSPAGEQAHYAAVAREQLKHLLEI